METGAGESAMGRVAVIRGQHLVPLLAAPERHFSSAGQPWRGVLLERHSVSPGEIPEHEHPSLCIHLQITGKDDFEWWEEGKNEVEHTQPGSLIVIPAGTRDRLVWRGSSERLVLSVEMEDLQDLASQFGAQYPQEFRGAWSRFDPSLRVLLTEMGREAREGWPLGTLYADLLGLSLQTTLLKRYSVSPIPVPALKGGLSLSRLRAAMEYITANLSDDLRLREIAGNLGLSASHFAHEFRNSTGGTPYQYLLKQRLEKARTLLASTQLPIQNVAALTGFHHPTNLIRAFRQKVGQSPLAWRKEHGRGGSELPLPPHKLKRTSKSR
jgi:AraC family transcriptional regulator